MFKLYCLTLFPDEVKQYFLKGIFKKAYQENMFEYQVINLRDFGVGPHKKVDEYPFSEKKGMILRADVVLNALRSIEDYDQYRVIYTCPKGPIFDQVKATELKTKEKGLIIIPGYYEGIDERIFECCNIERLSIGNMILNSGDTAAVVIAETIVRCLPNVLGNPQCINDESLHNGLLEAPHYTQPLDVEGHKVPDVLRSGHHKKSNDWKYRQSLQQTLFNRPDLLKDLNINKTSRDIMTKILEEA